MNEKILSRHWVPLPLKASNNLLNSPFTFIIMSYNILFDKYVSQTAYPFNSSKRRLLILQEILERSADIVTMQEVSTKQFYDFFLPMLKENGYEAIFHPKSRVCDDSDVDGCAIFYGTTKFKLTDKQYAGSINFKEIAKCFPHSRDMTERVESRNNIALVALLYPIVSNPSNNARISAVQFYPILVCTTHLPSGMNYRDVKLVHTMMLISKLEKIKNHISQNCNINPNNVKIIITGDFNSAPTSSVFKFITSGNINAGHHDFQNYSYRACLKEIIRCNKNKFIHTLQLASANQNNVVPYTLVHKEFQSIVDYIFYSSKIIVPIKILGAIDANYFQLCKTRSAPCEYRPSDHFPLVVEFAISEEDSLH